MAPIKTAVMRKPANKAGSGLTTANLGKPDLGVLAEQHMRYCQTLKSLGINVVMLDEQPAYPDSYFVEDTAVVLPKIAVLTRPGAWQRRGEVALIEPVLAEYRTLERIVEPGTLDGGDVLLTNHRCIVGVSSRTNREGACQLAEIVSGEGFHVDLVNLDEGLHLKSSLNALDDESVLVAQRLSSLECLSDFRKLCVPRQEEYAANALAIGRQILVSEEFAGTKRLLIEHNYDVIALPTSEIRKMDGGLTCLSLRID